MRRATPVVNMMSASDAVTPLTAARAAMDAEMAVMGERTSPGIITVGRNDTEPALSVSGDAPKGLSDGALKRFAHDFPMSDHHRVYLDKAD